MHVALRKLLISPSLYTTIFMAIGGVALSGANLILAKLLSAEAFGNVVLFQALASVAIGLAPLGVDSLIVRGEIGVDRRILSRTVIFACAFTVLLWGANLAFENLPMEIDDILLIGLACLGGAIAKLFTANEQSKEKFWMAQLISQAPYFAFLIFSALLIFFQSPTWQLGALAFVLGQFIGAALGYAVFARNAPDTRTALPGLWLRAVSFLGVLASMLLLSQLERLVIAGYLGLEAVATFGVAAALILAPYRILAAGIGFTLMPRLAANPSKSIRRALFRHELFVAAISSILGGLILVLLAPAVISAIYQDKYTVSLILLISLIIAGLIRTAYGFVSASMGGIGNTRMLHKFNLFGWLGTGVAALAAVSMTSLGLPGVIAGVSLGWLIRIVAGLILMRESST